MGLPKKAEKLALASPQSRRIKKGELLFAEGEKSREMYLLKTGVIRLFKKKGNSEIELETIQADQILGELAFLDGQARSASGEAMTECEIVEISGKLFEDTLTRIPDWLKILIKTVVGRLRIANTRIRQLEAANTAVDYSGKDGKPNTRYLYLSTNEILKIASGILLTGARNGNKSKEEIEIQAEQLHRYINQIMGVPVAKITTVVEIFSEAGIMNIVNEEKNTKYFLKDIDFLEKTISYINEQNILGSSRQIRLTGRGFQLMTSIARNLGRFKKNEATGKIIVNLAEIKDPQSSSQESGEMESFRAEDFENLVRAGYISALDTQEEGNVLTSVDEEAFMQAFRLQQISSAIQQANVQKSRIGK